MNFSWNFKCILQGGFAVLLFWMAYYQWTYAPGILTSIFLFWLVYVMNAFFDEIYGCEHGDIYKVILGKTT